jgi:hypothetical protein
MKKSERALHVAGMGWLALGCNFDGMVGKLLIDEKKSESILDGMGEGMGEIDWLGCEVCVGLRVIFGALEDFYEIIL